jgi:hypothetical protein
MKTLTDDAQRRLDHYLRQVRATLSGCRSVNADEVERDLREHIDRELTGASDPASLSDLNAVLDRLGSPSQWVPAEELPWWRRFLMRWRTGPEDWRLAYLAFGLLLLGVLFPLPLWPLVPASYLVSRAVLTAAAGRNEDVGAHKWLVYPSLLIVDIVLLGLILLGPPAFAGGCSLLVHGPPDFTAMSIKEQEFLLAVLAAATAVWLVVLGVIVGIWPRTVQAVFRPFADGIGRQHAKALVCSGLGLVALLGIAVTIRLWVYAGA